MSEKWLPIANYEGWYDVSDFGRVRRMKPGHGTFIGRILKPITVGYGYPGVALSKNDGGTNRTIHSLVAETFIGPCPKNMEVNHKDGDKTNNHVENLEYITRAENMAHARASGLISNRGENCITSKLAECDVHRIRKLFGVESHMAIAGYFGVSGATIDDIAAGRTWAWLEEK